MRKTSIILVGCLAAVNLLPLDLLAQEVPPPAHPFGWSESVRGTGVAGIEGGNLFISSPVNGTFDPTPTLRVDRNMSPTSVSGRSGDTYKALWVNSIAGEKNQGFEWAITAQLHNKALGSLNSENVAINGTAFVENNGSGETGSTWGGNFVVNDYTSTIDPAFARVGLEVNNYAKAEAGTDARRQRVGLQIAYGPDDGRSPPLENPLHIGRGILITSNNANTVMDRILEVTSQGTYFIGFDFTSARFTGPVMLMKDGQRIAFDGDSTGSYWRSVFQQDGELHYASPNGRVLSVSDDGGIRAGWQGSAGAGLSLTNALGTCSFVPKITDYSVACSSDARLMATTRETRSALEWLRDFRVVDYKISPTGDREFGVVAQEVQKTHPSMVTTQKDGNLAVYTPNSWMLIKAIQEQQTQIFWLQVLCAAFTALILSTTVICAIGNRRAGR